MCVLMTVCQSQKRFFKNAPKHAMLLETSQETVYLCFSLVLKGSALQAPTNFDPKGIIIWKVNI